MQHRSAQFDLPDGRVLSATLAADDDSARLFLTIGTEKVELDARQRAVLAELDGVSSILRAAHDTGLRLGLLPPR